MEPALNAVIEPIAEHRWMQMRDKSWREHPACPARSALALIHMNHWGFDERVHRGTLVVAAELAREIVQAFEQIFAARFPIERMTPVAEFGGDDEASMAANNCSAFNFRVIAGTERLSQHSFGNAIDINPVQNPWLSGGRVLPEAGRAYIERAGQHPGMIVRPGPVTDAFDAVGWDWGGDWSDYKDYHHFAKQTRDA
ncbi:M15 family metallopeptidase [Haliangium ochraceum]|uniref:Putative cytoplasmic protein n=1 Tax=Haliangium ochraceum (strain DSM 14365 / JCM 11303 / SMP-2) TaxID=502025 RepID=D0LZM8_HALO1|nr:M15 family metallopeptidase [Haliangium ochraceum]ACY18007.1 putative cytoplasmic protein [Haliangium ochraceum DSM 14365]